MKKAFENDIKLGYMMSYSKMIVHIFLAYKKHYDITKFNYNHIVKEAKDEVVLSEEDMNTVYDISKWTLKEYYGIEIIKDNPIEIKKG